MRNFILENLRNRLLFLKESDGNFNFRCPECGDSKKVKNKTRGWLYLGKDKKSFNFYCYNCGSSRTFRNFLVKNFPDLINPYNIYSVKSGIYKSKQTILKKDSPKFNGETKKLLLDVSNKVQKDSTVGKYCKIRNISTERLLEIDSIGLFIDGYSGSNHSKLVIPFYDEFENLLFVQFRSVEDSDTSPKYITYRTSENTDKIFGLDEVDFDTPFYVFEGALDSLLVNNSVAVCDAKVHKFHKNNKNAIFVPDPDYKNEQILKIIENIIELNLKIVLLPKNGQDLSDWRLETPLKNIDLFLKENTYYGLSAKLKIGKLK